MVATGRERRKNPRLRPSTYALSANEEILAEIIDISNCGISCRCLTGNNKLPGIIEMGLLNCTFGKSVENLSCRMVRSNRVTANRKTFVDFSLEFLNLTSRQLSQLDQFIKST